VKGIEYFMNHQIDFYLGERASQYFLPLLDGMIFFNTEIKLLNILSGNVEF